MFTVIYRWHIKKGLEQQFIENWAEVTESYYLKCEGALGSRLHLGNDGLWYAYAQWESVEARQNAFETIPKMIAREKMHEAIEESFPEIKLDILADFLQFPEKK